MLKSLLLIPIALSALAVPAWSGQNHKVVPNPSPVVANSDGQLEITAMQLNSRTPQIYVTQMGLLVSPRPEDAVQLSFYEATQVYIEEVLPRLKARLTRWKSDADLNPARNRTQYLNDQLQNFLQQDGAIARIDHIDATMRHSIPESALDAIVRSEGLRQANGLDSGRQTGPRPQMDACGPNGSPMTQQRCCSEVCDPSGCHMWCNLCNCRTGGAGCCGYGL